MLVEEKANKSLKIDSFGSPYTPPYTPPYNKAQGFEPAPRQRDLTCSGTEG